MESKMTVSENSLLATMNPILLLIGLALVITAGCFCAWKFRDTNDFAKSTRLYIAIVIIVNIILIIIKLPIIIILGLDICGFIAMALRSNHYF